MASISGIFVKLGLGSTKGEKHPFECQVSPSENASLFYECQIGNGNTKTEIYFVFFIESLYSLSSEIAMIGIILRILPLFNFVPFYICSLFVSSNSCIPDCFIHKCITLQKSRIVIHCGDS